MTDPDPHEDSYARSRGGARGESWSEPVIGSVCTGYGGLDLGVLGVLGGRLAWVADPDPAAAAVLAARFPGVPNLGDITTTDWSAVEPVDVLTAGFPCQDISTAGHGVGITKGTRSGLWFDVLGAVRDLRPALVVVENVAALRSRRGGLGVVLGTLAALGYDARWRSVRASDIGAPHRRERIFILAYPAGARAVPTPRAAGAAAAGGAADPARAGLAGPGDPSQPATSRTTGSLPDAVVRLLPTPMGPTTTAPPHRRCGCDNDARSTCGISRRSSRCRSRTSPVHRSRRRRGCCRRLRPATRTTLRTPSAGWRTEPVTGTGGSTATAWGCRCRSRSGCFPTPLAGEARAGSPNQHDSSGQPGLNATVLRLLPTPRASGNRNSRAAVTVHRSGPGLEQAVELVLGVAPAELTGTPPPSWTIPGAVGGDPATDTNTNVVIGGGGEDDTELGTFDWGDYTPAVLRWTAALGRTPPHPTEPGRTGRPRLAAAFVEWLMGLPLGWVTTTGITRAAQIRTLGNGARPGPSCHRNQPPTRRPHSRTAPTQDTGATAHNSATDRADVAA